MNLADATDHELLRQFSREGSQAAFAEIVRRHLDLVYSAARRQVRSSQQAEDVAQSVFVDLSRAAGAFKPGTPVVAWLHLVTRRTAIDAVRREVRREERERAAFEVSIMHATPDDWERVEPVLDETLAELKERERSAVILRFFENKTLRQVGQALGISDDAAQKCVSRALDQLKSSLLKRGVALTAAGLAADLSAHGVQTAPAMLGPAIIGSAKATVAAGLAQAAASEGARTLVMTSVQKIIVAGVAAGVGLLLTGVGVWVWQGRELDRAVERNRSLEAELAEIRRETDGLKRPAGAESVADPASVAALEGKAVAWAEREKFLKEIFLRRPELGIPELAMLGAADWTRLAREEIPEDTEKLRELLANVRADAKMVFGQALRQALDVYLESHALRLPESVGELSAYLKPPATASMLGRYQMIRSGNYAKVGRSPVIDEIAAVDAEYDWRLYIFAPYGSGTYPFKASRSVGIRDALVRYLDANNRQLPTSPAQLLPYFEGSLTANAQEDLLKMTAEDFSPKRLRGALERGGRP